MKPEREALHKGANAPSVSRDIIRTSARLAGTVYVPPTGERPRSSIFARVPSEADENHFVILLRKLPFTLYT